MSGHSKWSTIKRKKEVTDNVRGKLFSKLSKAISAAIASGGANPETNYKLKDAIEQARSVNMPKANIDRILSRAKEIKPLDEITYEGYGPSGVSVIVEVITDNKNRSSQEIKNLFENSGGNLAGPGAVSFNFVTKGLMLIEKEKDKDAQMLKLIDLGAEDIEETEDGVEIYVEPHELHLLRKKVEEIGHKVIQAEITQKPINLINISDQRESEKVIRFLESIQDHDDVQKVFANINIVGNPN